MRVIGLFILGILCTQAVQAQDAKRPESWKIRLDHGGPVPDSLEYVTMPPGWHITTGRHAGIFWDPAWRAAGNYRIASTMFLFPSSRQEGYGLFIGGRDLEGKDQAYLYFLLRRDGKYLIKRRQGTETRDIVPWTEHPAIVRLEPDAASNVKNVIVVAATTDRIRFLVNDQEVTSLPRSEVDARGEGQVGLRMNHGINVHVAAVEVLPP